ncbi:thioredoxin family protein [Pseudodesulfovibrio sp.]|uniref:thioredoxin family protein n=1 Tax=Pseudodesulfovibrio sp. TaxID=2035812 RepID=UPI002628AC0F|nr:thioredoxin family protein [Pseudodesulfovibrio sp.]MDD3311888.1 thioredoxin family protein [Pseudodesulfovibrio sp.]
MLKVLEPQAFEVELQSDDVPLLVAFLKRNERFRGQYSALDEASVRFGARLRCFLYDTDYLDMELNRFQVKGTPTFLLFSDGREVDRLIGESDRETLEDFIRDALDRK